MYIYIYIDIDIDIDIDINICNNTCMYVHIISTISNKWIGDPPMWIPATFQAVQHRGLDPQGQQQLHRPTKDQRRDLPRS